MKNLLLLMLTCTAAFGQIRPVSYDNATRNVSPTDLDYVGASGNFTTLQQNSVGVATTETLSWFDGSQATRTWTFNLSGIDPVITFGSGVVNISTGTLQQGGTAVVLTSRTMTIAGTANEITSSAGAQDLSANRTWTLSLPTALTFTGKTVTGGTFSSPSIGTPTITGAITFPDNVRQTFNPGADASGINVGSHAGDPGTPSNGDLWYSTSANALRASINGSTVSLGAGGGGSAPVGTVVNAGTPVQYALPYYSDTTGTNVAPSGLITDATGTNFFVGGFYIDTLVVTNPPTFTGAPSLILGNGATSSGVLRILEDTDNGSNYGDLTVPSALGGNRTYTFPDSSTTIPIISQTITISGPSAARTITVPDANFTAARTDAANTFTGIQTFSTPIAVASGGLGIGSGTSGGIPYFSGSTTIASSAALAANALVVGGGAGAAPSTVTTGAGNLTALALAANATGGFVTDNGTATLTGKTFNAASTGNSFTQLDYLPFVFPARVDGAGCTIVTNSYTDNTWGLATYLGTADTNGNYALFRLGNVPFDLNTAVEVTLRGLAIRTAGTSTTSPSFTIAYYQPAASDAGMPTDLTACSGFIISTAVTITSAAAGDVFYFSDITLTGWAAALTAGRQLIIAIARGDNGNNDTISVTAGSIEYTSTQ